MIDRLIVAKNIKLMREASCLTQDKVAEFLGIGRSAYSNYELGTRDIPLNVMESLAKKMLVTAFRVDDLSSEDMNAIAAFKHVVKNYVKMDMLLKK